MFCDVLCTTVVQSINLCRNPSLSVKLENAASISYSAFMFVTALDMIYVKPKLTEYEYNNESAGLIMIF